jgi:hypothetical protein
MERLHEAISKDGIGEKFDILMGEYTSKIFTKAIQMPHSKPREPPEAPWEHDGGAA